MSFMHSGESSRVALVTGSAGIIGPGIVRSLQAAGWKVAAAEYDTACFDRYRALYREEMPGDVLLTGDLSKRDACFRLVEEASSKLNGPVRLLVNTATGHSRSVHLPFDQFDEVSGHRVFDVDFLAPIFLMQAALEQLKNGGCIIHFSSVRTGEFVPGSLMYSSVKSAIETMTQALAVELSPHHIRVNAIRIGSIPGIEFLRQAVESLSDEEARALRKEVYAKLIENFPEPSLFGRTGIPEDVGDLIVYIASEKGAFLNGSVIPLDGGYHSAQRRLAEPPKDAVEFIRKWRKTPEAALAQWRASREEKARTENL